MGMRLFVGNLPFSVSESELTDLFSPHGEVSSVRIITDRETGRPRGFGFVEFANSDDGDAAIRQLNGTMLNGRAIVVNEAKPQEKRSGGGGGGFGGGRDSGGYGGGRDSGGGGYGGGGYGGGGYGGGRGGRDDFGGSRGGRGGGRGGRS